jgi:hypothetical protein
MAFGADKIGRGVPLRPSIVLFSTEVRPITRLSKAVERQGVVSVGIGAA